MTAETIAGMIKKINDLPEPYWMPVVNHLTDMTEKLKENLYKGGWQHEQIFGENGLLRMLEDEVAELCVALVKGNPKEIQRECADISNFAMMIADLSSKSHI